MITLDCTQEFSWAVTEFAGYSYWLHQKEIPHRVIVGTGWSPFFYWKINDHNEWFYEIYNEWSKRRREVTGYAHSVDNSYNTAHFWNTNTKEGGPEIIERNFGSMNLLADNYPVLFNQLVEKILSAKRSIHRAKYPGYNIVMDCHHSSIPFSKFVYQEPPDIYWDPYKQFKTWTPPPLKDHYSKITPLVSKKPVIVINNKYNSEWGTVPMNYFPINFLRSFVDEFKDRFDIYYIRFKHEEKPRGYGDWDIQKDAGRHPLPPYNDKFLLDSKIEGVKSIYQLMEEYKIDHFNLMQCYMLGKAKYVLSLNGGNGCLSSYFGDDVVMYGNPKARSASRRVWKSGTWLDKICDTNNVTGYTDRHKVLVHARKKWV